MPAKKWHTSPFTTKEKCTCDNRTPQFSKDGLIEWCTNCGLLICDHHQRKFGKKYPEC